MRNQPRLERHLFPMPSDRAPSYPSHSQTQLSQPQPCSLGPPPEEGQGREGGTEGREVRSPSEGMQLDPDEEEEGS